MAARFSKAFQVEVCEAKDGGARKESACEAKRSESHTNGYTKGRPRKREGRERERGGSGRKGTREGDRRRKKSERERA